MWKRTTDSGPAGDDQFDQQIVGLADGSFVVLWTDNSNGGVGSPAGTDIIGQRYDAEGNKVGGEFRANALFTTNDQGEFTAAALPDGGFVVVYEDTDADGTTIRFTKWNATASDASNNTILADPGADTLNSPSGSVNEDGSFLVGFQQINAAGTSMNVRFVQVASTLVAGSPIFAFAGDVPSANSGPQVDSALLTNGNTVLVSRTDPTDQAGAQDQIIFQLVNGSNLVGSSSSVADTATNGDTDNAPSVAALTGGGFVVAWQNTDATDTDVRFQRFTAAGIADGLLTAANNTGGTDNKATPDVIGLSDGGSGPLRQSPVGRLKRIWTFKNWP